MGHPACPLVPVSWGELLDKITILEIKRERIEDTAARANVARELAALRDIAREALVGEDVVRVFAQLKLVNETLWDVEDAIRQEEARGVFGAEFVRLARAVYHRNDERAELKRAINKLLQSELVEEKSYWSQSEPRPPAAQPVPG
jgi:protein subunit release factor A